MFCRFLARVFDHCTPQAYGHSRISPLDGQSRLLRRPDELCLGKRKKNMNATIHCYQCAYYGMLMLFFLVSQLCTDLADGTEEVIILIADEGLAIS